MFALLRIGRVMRPGGGESYLFYLIVTARQNNLNSHMKSMFLMNYYLLSCDTLLINLYTDVFKLPDIRWSLMTMGQFYIGPIWFKRFILVFLRTKMKCKELLCPLKRVCRAAQDFMVKRTLQSFFTEAVSYFALHNTILAHSIKHTRSKKFRLARIKLLYFKNGRDKNNFVCLAICTLEC